ncbi:MAG: GntR family transcriptional regulator [Bryobacteraceae bacterium]
MIDHQVVFAKVAAVTLRDRVVAALKDSFFSGMLKPGDLIVERQVARQMGIGTPAVREALITLQGEGFVQRVANTATYVRRYTVTEVEELYNLRMEIECLALQWAKNRVTEKDLTNLEAITEQMVQATRSGKVREFYELDLAFHRVCWNISGNRFLVSTLETLVVPLFAFVLRENEGGAVEETAKAHLQIVNALRRLEEPEFSTAIRKTLAGFALKGLGLMARLSADAEKAGGATARRR